MTTLPRPELSLVVPVHDEGATIGGTLVAWLDEMSSTGLDVEMIAIDDGSTDATPAILDAAANNDARLRVIHQAQRGHGPAVIAGYRAARGPWIFQFDGDDEIGAPFFGAVWAHRGDAPLVLGARDGSHRPWLRRHLTRVAARIVSLAARQRIEDPNVPFRLISRAALEHALERLPDDLFAPNLAMTLLVALSDGPIVAVPVVERRRHVARRALGGWRLYRGACQALLDVAGIVWRDTRQRRR